MSSQLQSKPPPSNPSPYSNIPGYRTNEPQNSAWNRTILSYHSAGVPYTIQEGTPPPSKSSSSPSLGSASISSPTKSTNPAFESALMESFTKNPEGFAGRTGYFGNLFTQGVLTQSDYDKLNQIITSYNEKISQQNAISREQNRQSFQKEFSDITTTLTQAKQSGIKSLDVTTSKGIKLGTVNPQNISQARLEILNFTKSTSEPLSLSYQNKTTQISSSKITGITSKETTYQPADLQTALIGGAVGGFAQIGLMGLAGIARLTGKTIKTGGVTITPTGGILAQSSSITEQRVGSDVVSNFLAGKQLAKSPTLEIASLVGFGASMVATGGTGLISKGVVAIKEGITLSKFISSNLPVVTEQISAKEAVTKTSNIISVFEQQAGKIQSQIENLGKTPLSEKILGVSITKEGLQAQAKALSTYKEQILTNIGQLKSLKSSFEILAAKSPTAIVATVKANPVQKVEKLGQGVYALYYPAASKYTGGIVTLGQKGVGSLIQIGKELPEGTKAIRSAELMSGVRGVIRQASTKYANLSGPEKTAKTTKDVFAFLKTQKSSYEVTYPKIKEGAESFGNISIGPVTEREIALGKAFVPEPSILGVGEELTFGNISKITSENKFALSREILGTREATYTKAATSGEIHFMESNIKNIIGDINLLKEPIMVREFKSGLGELVGSRAKGFNYLASRFGGKIKESFNPFKKSTPFGRIEETKGRAGSKGRTNALERATDKYVLEQMMKESSLNPLTRSERSALVKELGRRVAREKNPEVSKAKSFERIVGRSTGITTGRFRKNQNTEYEMIISGKSQTIPKESTSTKTILTPISKTIQKPETTTRINEILRPISETKINTKTMPVSKTIPITTTIPISITKTNTKQLTKQSQKQIQKETFPGLPKLPGLNPPPPGKRKPPFDFPFFLPNPIQGPGSMAGGGGAKKAYVGNVPEYQFTGMYNRIETIYGRARTPKVPKSIKANRGVSKERSFVFNQNTKPQKTARKSLSSKFDRII